MMSGLSLGGSCPASSRPCRSCPPPRPGKGHTGWLGRRGSRGKSHLDWRGGRGGRRREGRKRGGKERKKGRRKREKGREEGGKERKEGRKGRRGGGWGGGRGGEEGKNGDWGGGRIAPEAARLLPPLPSAIRQQPPVWSVGAASAPGPPLPEPRDKWSLVTPSKTLCPWGPNSSRPGTGPAGATSCAFPILVRATLGARLAEPPGAGGVGGSPLTSRYLLGCVLPLRGSSSHLLSIRQDWSPRPIWVPRGPPASFTAPLRPGAGPTLTWAATCHRSAFAPDVGPLGPWQPRLVFLSVSGPGMGHSSVHVC